MDSVITWPAPAGELPSPDYTVEVNGRPVFVYPARVRCELLQKEGLWTHKPHCPAERASFALFDIRAPVTVTVRPARPFTTAAVLPHRAGIRIEAKAGAIRFALDAPRPVTVILDDSDREPLHLFVAEPETEVPRADDPRVIYFGPGAHEIHGLQVKSGQTVYLAGGAVVRCVLPPDAKGVYDDKWKVTFHHGTAFSVQDAEDVRICGRGILDGSAVPHPGWQLVGVVGCRRVRLEGITLRDAPNWNVMLRRSNAVRVDNLRLIGGRLNSDGINSVNSSDVRIRRCFVRNHDDSIVVKTVDPGAPSEDITVEECTLWSDWGYSLGVTYETRAPIRRVSYRACDILYARHWCLGVRLSDSATVSDISFRDIEVSRLTDVVHAGGAYAALTDGTQLADMTIVNDIWGQDPECGHIRDVRVEDITVCGRAMPPSRLAGFDAEHAIHGVAFRNVRRSGQPPAADAPALRLTRNAHVHGLTIEAGG